MTTGIIPADDNKKTEKPKRKPISKRVRFEVFKRDRFMCQYCGQTPPAVVLEVDHVLPVSAGGTNALHNLVSACFDCNRGKAAGLLSSVPESVAVQAELAAEKIAQVKAFDRLIKAQRKLEEAQINEVEDAFRVYFPRHGFAPKFRQSVRVFLQKLPAHQVVDHMHLACGRISNMNDATKYFCGICWKQIKGQQ